MPSPLQRLLISAWLSLGLLACGDSSSTNDGGTGADTSNGPDATRDTGATPDATPDTTPPEDTGAPDTASPPDARQDGTTPDANGTGANYAFVSSTRVVPGDLGGLDGADEECNRIAALAALPGTYVAWLSSSEVDARDRLGDARGWVRTDGKAFADDQASLTSGANWAPLDRDENGEQVTGQTLVLTATAMDGTASGDDCGGWAEPTEATTTGGSAAAMGRRWTSGNVPRCDGSIVLPRLYCLGVSRTEPVAPVTADGRRAFLSEGTFSPDAGAEVADSLCQLEAEEAGLSGSFRALLASESASALSRFNLDGGAWVRTDGLPLGLFGTSPPTAIHVHAEGTTYDTDASWVWTGADTPSTPGADSTCDSWMSASGELSASVGAALVPASYFRGLSRPCDTTPYPVYCLEE